VQKFLKVKVAREGRLLLCAAGFARGEAMLKKRLWGLITVGAILGLIIALGLHWPFESGVHAQQRTSLSSLQALVDSLQADVDALQFQLVSEVAAAHAQSAPVGSIVAWHESLAGTPAYTAGYWVRCNGQTVSDSESPYNGVTVPNLNASGRFLRGGLTSGVLQESAVGSHTHGYQDYYWEDTGNDGLYSNPTGDDVGQRVQILRTTSATGESETRPINMSVVWMIRIK
jgi:hypothetical protein